MFKRVNMIFIYVAIFSAYRTRWGSEPSTSCKGCVSEFKSKKERNFKWPISCYKMSFECNRVFHEGNTLFFKAETSLRCMK